MDIGEDNTLLENAPDAIYPIVKMTNRQQAFISKIGKIFNVKSSTMEETRHFRNISHRQLAEAFEYWLDQCKTLFGEPLLIQHTQSLHDAGVDIVADTLKSKLRLGIQVKSHGDIREKQFSTKVLAQISQSKKHGLSNLIVALAADLTDQSQVQKAGYLISEIHQQKDNQYALTIPPEKVLTIYNAYKKKEHPLKFVELSIHDAFSFVSGIAEGLSNESRKVNVSIDIQYLNLNKEDYPVQAKIKFKIPPNMDVLDAIERMPITGELLEFNKENVEEVRIYEKGELVFKSADFGHMKFGPDEKDIRITLQVLNEKGEIADSINELQLLQTGGNGAATKDDEEPLRFSMQYDMSKNQGNLHISVDQKRGATMDVLRALQFYDALAKSRKLRMVETKSGEAETVTIPNDSFTQVPPKYLDFVRALSELEKKAGRVLKIPEDLSIFDKREIAFVLSAAKYLANGTIPISGMVSSSTMPRVQALVLLTDYKNGQPKDDLRNEMMTIKILGYEIKLGPSRIPLSQVQPVGNLDELIDKLAKSQDELATIEFKAKENAEMTLEWFRKKLEPQ